MYIEKIKIDKFRVLEDIEIRFQPPGGATADPETGNVVNVIAGVNGTGKTSLLEVIFLALSQPNIFWIESKNGGFSLCGFPDVNAKNWHIYWDEVSKLKQEGSINSSFYDKFRLVFLPSQQSFEYSSVTQMTVQYSFAQKVDIQRILGNAEFYTKEYVLNKVLESNIADPVQRTKAAVDAFNSHFLNANLLTRLSNLSKILFNRPVFSNAANQEVTIDQLSDGEKQLYGRVIALMILNPNNSIILIDEPEISLHPAWQQKIMQIYSRVGKNNQFIIATHSPQIIANTLYQNVIVLHKKEGKIIPLYPTHPPAGVDVNSILAEIMGVEQVLPQDVEVLHRQYRKLLEDKQEDSPEAEEVRKKLLQRESNDSKFMQEMRFLMRLRGSK